VAPEQLKEPQNAFPGSGHQSEELEELKNLSEENRKLKLEREILKKAEVFFALLPLCFLELLAVMTQGPR